MQLRGSGPACSGSRLKDASPSAQDTKSATRRHPSGALQTCRHAFTKMLPTEVLRHRPCTIRAATIGANKLKGTTCVSDIVKKGEGNLLYKATGPARLVDWIRGNPLFLLHLIRQSGSEKCLLPPRMSIV